MHSISQGFIKRCAQRGYTHPQDIQHLMKIAKDEGGLSSKQWDTLIGGLTGAGLGGLAGYGMGGGEGAVLGALGGGLGGAGLGYGYGGDIRKYFRGQPKKEKEPVDEVSPVEKLKHKTSKTQPAKGTMGTTNTGRITPKSWTREQREQARKMTQEEFVEAIKRRQTVRNQLRGRYPFEERFQLQGQAFVKDVGENKERIKQLKHLKNELLTPYTSFEDVAPNITQQGRKLGLTDTEIYDVLYDGGRQKWDEPFS